MNYDEITPEFLKELAAKFPHAWLEFSNYIVNSQSNFGPKWPFYYDEEDKQYYTATFQTLPYMFQVGLFIQYIIDRGGCSWEIDDMYEFNLKDEMYSFFVMINDEAE